MNLTIILFLIGILGFVLNKKNIILMLISIEIILLSITFLILISSLNIDDIIGQTYAIYVIIVAGAESAIGLAILVAFYRLNLSLFSFYLSYNYTSLDYKNFNKIAKQVRCYSTDVNNKNLSSSLSPWFITGIFDAESSFVITILKNPRYKTGWNVQARVQIKLHEIDRTLIESISKYFGDIGYISKSDPNNLTVEFRISTLNDLIDIIIPHFDKYPLKTKKHVDFLLFKKIVLLMKNKEHSTLEGILKIVNLRASLNNGLTKNLKEAFPDVSGSLALNDLNYTISYDNIDPQWMAGFCTGESNFFIKVQDSKTKIGSAVSLRFSVGQHSRDLLLLESFVEAFNCGCTYNYNNRQICEFVITKIGDINKYVIPFFEENLILGSKYLNYLDFKKSAEIVTNKEHLTKEGLAKILYLKNKMTTFYKENL